MTDPRKMFFVLDMACVVVIGLNLPFALYGYFLFGKQTEGLCAVKVMCQRLYLGIRVDQGVQNNLWECMLYKLAQLQQGR